MMFSKIDQVLKPGDGTQAVVDLLFRVATSLIFIVGGLGHFREHQMMLDRMAKSPWLEVVSTMGDPSLLLWLSGLAFVLAGIMLALGWMTRASALVLFITLVPITIAIHVVPDKSHVGPLFKNIAILGALLYFWARGPGGFALDNKGKRSDVGE